MCTKVLNRSKLEYGYKVVTNIKGKAVSYYNSYTWHKGINRARETKDDWHQIVRRVKLKEDKEVGVGYFHCFKTLEDARYFKNKKTFSKLKIIKVQLMGQPWDGVNIFMNPWVDGKPSVVARTVKWDGKFIR